VKILMKPIGRNALRWAFHVVHFELAKTEGLNPLNTHKNSGVAENFVKVSWCSHDGKVI
jgi:hypothetical protein